jgi:K+-sensing histidine kinase KdpD
LQPVDLNAILEEQIATVREAYPEASIDAELPENVTVQADEMLSEVFGNLLTNAIEHNDKEEPVVEVSVEKRSETVVVDIADNGPGISSELADNLFEWSVDQETHNSAEGMGLRLVTTLVSEYGGDVWVEENNPEGSIIRVELEQEASGSR